MNSNKCCALAVAFAFALTTAHAQLAKTPHGIPDGPTRLTSSATSETGTLLKRELKWKSKIPLDKTYSQFTPEEKAEFRALYASLPEDDEPPFPVDGIKPLFKSLKKGQSQLQARGELNLAVTVNTNGDAIRVEDFGGVKGVNAHEMTQYAQSVFMMAKFKPGVCSGQPCVMQFPFRIKLN